MMSTKKLKNGIEELSKKVNLVVDTVNDLSDADSKEGQAYRDYLRTVSNWARGLRAKEVDKAESPIELSTLLENSPLIDLVTDLADTDMDMLAMLTQVQRQCELAAALALHSEA